MSDSKEPELNLGRKLLSVESILHWKPVIYEENFNEISCELEPQPENQFNFNNYIIPLVKSYQAVEADDIDLALKTVKDLEDSAKAYEDEFFKRIETAYYHVIYASQNFLFSSKQNRKEATMALDKIVPIDTMDASNKAAICAMKATVFALYSNEDTQKAFVSIDKALTLDPQNGHWHFLKALIIRKIRKMTNPFEVPTLSEKELFEKAFAYDASNVVYKLHLAEVYREISSHASKRQENCSHFLPKDSSLTKNLRSNIDDKITKAVEYFIQAAEEYPDSPYVMFKSAEGLARLYPQFNNIKLVKKLTKDGLKKSPENINGNLVMAFLCEHIDKNYKDAEKHLKTCQSKKIFDADINMIRFLHSTKPSKFNGVQALEILLDKYKEKKRHAILYSQMVSYYMFIKLDVVKACESAIKFFSLNTGSSCMQIHRSLFIQSQDPFSLIDVLNDEVKYVINAGDKTSSKTRESCEKYIQYINFQNVRVIQGFPQNFRNQILQGKPMTINPNCVAPPKKFNQLNKNTKKRETNGGRGDYRNQSNMSNKPNPDRRQNSQHAMKPATDPSRLPSLMDVSIPISKSEATPAEPNKPVVAIEKEEFRSEENDEDAAETKDKQLAKLVLNMIKSKRENKTKNLHGSHDESDESISETLKRLVFGEKDTRSKKYRSDSETDSDRRRRRDRRRERSRRRRRSDSYSDSDDSDHDRRYHRRNKRHSSRDSETHSRSARHQKSYKKDRYERDYSPRDRRSRRNRYYSSDEDSNFNLKSSHYRNGSSPESQRPRRSRKGSVSRSPSYDRRSRKRSPKKEKSSRKERKNSFDRYSSRDHKLNGIDHRKDKDRKSKSSKQYDRDGSPRGKKSRRRSTSREKSHDRDQKTSRSKKERRTKRDQNSTTPESGTEFSSYEKKSQRRSTSREKSERGKPRKSKKDRNSKAHTKTKRDQNSTTHESGSE